MKPRVHFYTLLTGVCALCEADSPDICMFGLFCVTPFRTRSCTPCDTCGIYPCALCSGNSLLAQPVSVAKSENSISLRRPSTENVGGLFLSIFISFRRLNLCTKKKLRSCKQRKEKLNGSLRRSNTKSSGLRTALLTTKKALVLGERMSPVQLLGAAQLLRCCNNTTPRLRYAKRICLFQRFDTVPPQYAYP